MRAVASTISLTDLPKIGELCRRGAAKSTQNSVRCPLRYYGYYILGGFHIAHLFLLSACVVSWLTHAQIDTLLLDLFESVQVKFIKIF